MAPGLIVPSSIMNILLVPETSGPGGAETAMLNLGEAMASRGHHCLVAVPAQGWVSEGAEKRGLPWVQYMAHRRGSRSEAIRRLRRIVVDNGIDLIHAHMFDVSLYAALVSALTRVPMVSTIHGHADLKGKRRTIWAKFAILSLLARDVIFVSAALEGQVLREFPVIRSKARVIPNGIPVLANGTQKVSHGPRPGQQFTFGALGNIRGPKGYEILLDAAAQVCAQVPNIRILIAGEPDKAGLYERLLKKREELGLEERVEFLGLVADVDGFLSDIDCAVSSSVTEGMPLSLIEAMAHGLPVVATRCGGVPELIEHETHGLLCEPGDAGELASAMLRVIREPDLRDRMGKAAFGRAVTSFSLDAMCDRYAQLYVDAVGELNAA
jgi:glycosyltransferase involved in cell wall biosynthesis